MTGAPSPRGRGTRKERELSAAIIALLRAHGIMAWRTGGGAFKIDGRYVRMGTKGVSDVLGVMPKRMLERPRVFNDDGTPNHERGFPDPIIAGLCVAIEVKSPKGKIRPEQTAFLAEVVRHGGIGFVARSCEEVIDKLGLGAPR